MRIPVDFGTAGQVGISSWEELCGDAGRKERVEEVIEAESRDNLVSVEGEGAEGEEGGDRLSGAEKERWRLKEGIAHSSDYSGDDGNVEDVIIIIRALEKRNIDCSIVSYSTYSD